MSLSAFSKLVKFCLQQYKATPFCENCPMEMCYKCNSNDCYNCLRKIHNIQEKNEHYRCKKITYNYILKFGHRYASEIVGVFQMLREKLDESAVLNIYSVGCGPSTELYGITEALQDFSFNYKGFDLNPVWSEIQNFNCENLNSDTRSVCYFQTDFKDYMESHDDHIDVLVLNYFLSDFVKYYPAQCNDFLDYLLSLIGAGQISYIVINDIMLMYDSGTAYSCMKYLKDNLPPEEYHCDFIWGHYAEPNQFQPRCGEKLSNSLFFKIEESEIEEFAPFCSCGSIVLIIKCI